MRVSALWRSYSLNSPIAWVKSKIVKKLIRGIIDFHQNLKPAYRETFAKLALGQRPDALFVSCSDSRVAVNVFASTNPGDLFVIRNVGNMIPPCGESGKSGSDESEAAAVEFALGNLNVADIIICGHAECGAMNAIVNGRKNVTLPNLRSWLRHGEKALPADGKIDANELSKRNVLLQIEHLKTYPEVKKRHEAGTLGLHALWFDLPRADVYYYDPKLKQYVILDEATGRRVFPEAVEVKG